MDLTSLGAYAQQYANTSGLGDTLGTAANSAGLSSSQGTSGASFSFKLPQHIDPSSITNPSSVGNTDGAVSSASALGDINEPTSWGQMVQRMALDVNQAQTTAGEKVRDVLAGGNTSVQDAMVAVQESSVRFQMLAEVRNKMLDAYQEVMRMQV